MAEQNKQNTRNYEPVQVPPGLFDKIISAIKREKELRQGRKILFSLISLLVISVATLPFSTIFFVNEWRESGIIEISQTAIDNLGNIAFFAKDLALSVLESFPAQATIIFILNLALAIFTIRLFLYKKNLLFKYLFS